LSQIPAAPLAVATVNEAAHRARGVDLQAVAQDQTAGGELVEYVVVVGQVIYCAP
jgi:hypothetical protein